MCVFTPTHSQRRDSRRYDDSQMILCGTFFTCDNLLFGEDEAEFHFIILAILQHRQLSC